MSDQDPASAAEALVGDVVVGRYRILALLGQGAMGMVYAAWHLGLDQRVAFKLLRRGLDGELDDVAHQRFTREARAAARIQSDHVCRVIDNGTLDDGTPFLVMEYLEGCDLAAELVERGRLPVYEAVRYVRQACTALVEVHRAGIVHRDLKPANLFLQDTHDSLDPSALGRRLKVLDFGISKSTALAEMARASLTRTSALLGSPIYMSPEQLNSSRDVDARSDIWALGVILYELITGAMPFEGSSITQLVNAVLHRVPPPCSVYGVNVPPALEKVVERALQKDRALRYQTVAEFSLALALFERESSPDVQDAGADAGAPASGCDSIASTLDIPSQSRENWQISTLRTAARARASNVAPRAVARWRLPALALGAVLVGVLGSRALWPGEVRGAAHAGPPSSQEVSKTEVVVQPAAVQATATQLAATQPAAMQPSVDSDWQRPTAEPAPDELISPLATAAEAVSVAGKPAGTARGPRRLGNRRRGSSAADALVAMEPRPSALSAFGGRR